ncbi:MAG: ABC transporter ATP-binding protein [Candidatus Methylacidiphilales bacterium]|nr:ABC transporter ATP-binding protein [Candidatus Methylacidiphilales bacterium]
MARSAQTPFPVEKAPFRLPPYVGLALKYIRLYQSRLITGVLLASLYAMFSGLMVFAAKDLVNRVSPQPEEQKVVAASSSLPRPASQLQAFGREIYKHTSDWLPRKGVPLDWKQCVGGFLILPLLAVIRGSLNYSSTYYLKWVGTRLIADMGYEMMALIQRLSLDFFNTTKRSEIIERVKVDTKQLYFCIEASLTDAIKEPLTLLALLAALIYSDPRLTFFAVIFMPMCLLPAIILGRKVRLSKKSFRKATVAQTGILLEALQNVRAVKAFALEDQQLEEYRKFNRKSISHGMRATRATELLNPVIEVMSMIGVTGVIMYIIWSGLEMSDLAGFVTAMILAFGSIRKLGNLHMRYQASRVSLERLSETLLMEPTIREKPAAVSPPRFDGDIVFQDVFFSYGEKNILERINLRIPFGQRVGIVGPSGGGKSTLINLLGRFYDVSSGSITLGGHDVRDVTFAWLRGQMAFVGQETLLFNRSVAENIAMGRVGASRDEVMEAARLAQADLFIRELPDGYDTVIGEQGVLLSGGQRQRICLARAFVRKAPILVLDEATASLDSKIEAAVQTGIDSLSRDSTVLCVAHRLGTLKHFDRIIVLRDGEIIQDGTFAGLLQQDGLFANLASHQGLTVSLSPPLHH